MKKNRKNPFRTPGKELLSNVFKLTYDTNIRLGRSKTFAIKRARWAKKEVKKVWEILASVED